MSVTDILKSIQFVVDQEGKPTAALLDIGAWEAFVSMLEDIEDTELVQQRLGRWRAKEGWSFWEDFEAELDADALYTYADLPALLTDLG